jgi:hypothetical protein
MSSMRGSCRKHYCSHCRALLRFELQSSFVITLKLSSASFIATSRRKLTFFLAKCSLTEAHISSMELRYGYYGGRRRTEWPCSASRT